MIQMNENQVVQQFPVSSTDGVSLGPVNLPVSTRYKHMAEFQSMVGAMGPQQFLATGMQTGPMHMMTNQVQQKQPPSNKRKVSPDDAPNKKTVQVGSSSTTTRTSQLSGPNKRTAQQGSVSNSSRAGKSGKKVVQIEPVLSRSQSSASKHKASEVSPKPQVESSDSVRSKLRESLVAALALVSQQQEDSSAVDKNSGDPTVMNKETGDSKPSEMLPNLENPAIQDSREGTEPLPVSVSCPDANHNHDSSGGVDSKDSVGETTNSWEFVGHDFHSDAVLHVEDPAYNDSFFIKDDLLLGNGLSWALDFDGNSTVQVKPDHDLELKHDDVGVAVKEQAPVPMTTASDKAEPMQEAMLVHEDADVGEKPQVDPTPESVALDIEAELFKLFGGVNKKYKEKGRSLLFNLKDRNNPDLRERVMSGAISPERLCSMTAEELASKELSQWRIAKAEELAQMKVLPDVEVDIRRLVKKTHKGDIQVEFEQDVASSLDISSNKRDPFGRRSPANGSKSVFSDNVHGSDKKKDAKSQLHNSTNQDDEYRLTIPADAADVMQGLMEVDTRDLPPICSLDEFMESLDKEPPFEDLTTDSGKAASETRKSSLVNSVLENTSSVEAKSQPKLVEKASENPVEMEGQKIKQEKSKSLKVDAGLKPASGQREQKHPGSSVVKAEQVWDGLLQLNLSSTASLVGIYKSGEKAITKEWLDLFEVKGRVKLVAFEKFLQALPMSRTRTIMVANFALKDGSSAEDMTNLQEMVDSYIMESRVGFAEPAPGVELYLCPPHKGTFDMLIKHLSKSYTEKLDSIKNGFVGIVVWRKAQLAPAISPKPSGQNDNDGAIRHQPFSSRRHQEQISNSHAEFPPKPAPPKFASNRTTSVADDEDDVPPGFGPSAAREDDDLPEFNFSGGSCRLGAEGSRQVSSQPLPSRAPPKRVDEMRELIKKYGSGGNNVAGGIVLEPWNDDDDIPEWKPEAPGQWAQPMPKQTFPSHNQHPQILNQHTLQQPIPLAKPMQPVQSQFQPLQPPMPMAQNGAQWQQAQRWTPGPPNIPPSNLGNQLAAGQFLVAGQLGWDWKHDESRSRSRRS
ncbi:PHD finger protein 3-like protein [Drosera capensis]